MSIWNRLIEILNAEDKNNILDSKMSVSNMPHYVIIDVEIGITDHKIHDIGALRDDGAVFHNASKKDFFESLNAV